MSLFHTHSMGNLRPNPLDQRFADYSPWAKSVIFVNRVSLDWSSTHSFMKYLWMLHAAMTELSIETETVWPQSLNYSAPCIESFLTLVWSFPSSSVTLWLLDAGGRQPDVVGFCHPSGFYHVKWHGALSCYVPELRVFGGLPNPREFPCLLPFCWMGCPCHSTLSPTHMALTSESISGPLSSALSI